MIDQTVSDIDWWFSDWAEFEDFVGIGPERTQVLAEQLQGRVSGYLINRLLKANNLPHGPTNEKELHGGNHERENIYLF
jgi:hypothetical protein